MHFQMSGKEKIGYALAVTAIVFMVIEYKYEPVGITVDTASYVSNRIHQREPVRQALAGQAAAEQVAPVAHIAQTKKAKHISSPATSEHVVAKGETVYSISHKYGADPKAVCALNGLGTECTIHPGQHLTMAQK